jgi:hypothetical protein
MLSTMLEDQGFHCTSCGQLHDGPPFSYGAPAPAYWRHEMASDPGSGLADEQCVINGEHFFIRARIVLPVTRLALPDQHADDTFEWGVWVSLSEHNYDRACQLWNDPKRVDEPPYFGWLATEVPCYQPSTLNLKTRMHSQPVGTRPVLELEPTDHPLAVEQRMGITLARVQAIAEQLLHPAAR